MTTLTDFLFARIAEDEATALLAVVDLADEPTTGVIGEGSNVWPSHLRFTQQITPARVLAECEAKRRIVEHFLDIEGYGNHDFYVVALLATVYADHPDYDPEWLEE